MRGLTTRMVSVLLAAAMAGCSAADSTVFDIVSIATLQ